MFESVVRRLSRGALALAAASCLACLGVVCYAVGARYFFNAPQPWADEIVGWLMVATVMLAMPEAQRVGEHVAVDSLSERAKGRIKTGLDAFGVLTVAGTAAILIWEGWAMVAFSRLVAMASNIPGVPLWWVQALVPLGFALLLLVAALQLWRMFRGAPPVPPEENEDEAGDLPKIKAGPLE